MVGGGGEGRRNFLCVIIIPLRLCNILTISPHWHSLPPPPYALLARLVSHPFPLDPLPKNSLAATSLFFKAINNDGDGSLSVTVTA